MSDRFGDSVTVGDVLIMLTILHRCLLVSSPCRVGFGEGEGFGDGEDASGGEDAIGGEDAVDGAAERGFAGGLGDLAGLPGLEEEAGDAVTGFEALDSRADSMHDTAGFMAEDHGRLDDEVADGAVLPVVDLGE